MLAAELERVRSQRQSRRSVIGKNLLLRTKLGKRRQRIVNVFHSREQRGVFVGAGLIERLPERRPTVERKRSKRIGCGQPRDHGLAGAAAAADFGHRPIQRIALIDNLLGGRLRQPVNEPQPQANRRLAASATKTFTVYDSPLLPGAARIGLPLRRSAVGLCDVRDARLPPDVDLDCPPIIIAGGSQGALSVNDAVGHLARYPQVQHVLEGWQILHITGPGAPSRKGGANGERIADAKSAYDALGIPSRVMPFCDAMGDAWRAATVAISRSGAGAVAEAWTNATPTIFLPYPFHKDDHQRLNAEPLAADGGCILLRDLKDAGANASQMVGPFMQLACDDAKRKVMIETLRESEPADGADAVAHWVAQQVGV